MESLFNKAAGLMACNFIKKDADTDVLLREHSEIFKNGYFEVQTLENEIYSCFFVSKVMHTVLGKVKKKY